MKTYHIGEKVVHCPEGVCEVEDICQIEMDKMKKILLQAETDSK